MSLVVCRFDAPEGVEIGIEESENWLRDSTRSDPGVSLSRSKSGICKRGFPFERKRETADGFVRSDP